MSNNAPVMNSTAAAATSCGSSRRSRGELGVLTQGRTAQSRGVALAKHGAYGVDTLDDIALPHRLPGHGKCPQRLGIGPDLLCLADRQERLDGEHDGLVHAATIFLRGHYGGSATRGTTLGAVDLESFELVLLRRPADAPSYDDDALARIQREHLDFHAALRESGVVVTNGPVIDQPDESLRGLTFYRTGSVDEARRTAEQDPAVVAGRLAVEAMQWWCPRGTMTRPGRAISLPDD